MADVTGAEKKVLLEEHARTQRAKDKGASDLPSLQQALINKYGNILRAWKEGLDLDGGGKVSKMEFVKAMQKIGYKGSIKELWAQMDHDRSGFITLKEVAPTEAKMLDDFIKKCKDCFGGSMLTAWRRLLYPMNRGQIYRPEFSKICEVLNYTHDWAQLYDYLDYDRSGFITLAEIDQEAYEALLRGDDEFDVALDVPKTKNMKTLDFFERQRSQTTDRRRQAIGRKERRRVERIIKERREANVGASNLDGFQKALVRKHGNIMRAWKESMDVAGIGKLCFAEFCKSARNEGFNGNINTLWKQLDMDNSGFISLDEIAPVQGKMMIEFKRRLKAAHGGSMARAWKESLDITKAGRVSKEHFIDVCIELGIPHKEAKKVFEWVDYDYSGFITLDEIDAEAQRQIEREDDLMGLDVKEERTSPLDKTFEERQETEKSIRYRKEKKLLRDRLRAKAAEIKARNMNANPLASFFQWLTKNYKSVDNAWKVLLDPYARGSVTNPQFISALRMAGMPGNYPALWHVIDTANLGEITLEELQRARKAEVSPRGSPSVTEFDASSGMDVDIFGSYQSSF